MNDVHGVPTSVNDAVTAAGASGSLSVDPVALLRASNILRMESRELLSEDSSLQQGFMEPRGQDPVSGPAASGFQAKIDAILEQASAYATNLGTAADTLRKQAADYGATDLQAKQAPVQAAAERLRYQETHLAPMALGTASPNVDPIANLAQQYAPHLEPERAPEDLRPLVNPSASAPPAPPAPEAPAPTSSPFPPRPAELRINDVDPCSLLTPAEQEALGVERTPRDEQTPGSGTASCSWITDESPSRAWSIRTAVNRGAPGTVNSPGPTQIVQVENFGAIQRLAHGSVNGSCSQFIDIAQGQFMQVSYDTFDYPIAGMNYQVACQMTSKVSQYAIQNLRALAH
ncbi:MAG TPA: DUF3558 domain-containing protein [Pseudonocardia sp.]|uniref:DUF3558 domain-containing protein n=1 Tax=Pseudonocardia sp. TaxID=60912 RepID=UPI002F3F273D